MIASGQTRLLVGFTVALLLAVLGPAGAAAAEPVDLMVFAPHPDDEVLGAAGLIWNATQQGQTVIVVFGTVGDAYGAALRAYQDAYPDRADADGDGRISMLDLGRIRRAEAVRAAARLGLNESSLIFLGFPDAGLLSLWHDPSALYSSQHTGANQVPYEFTYRKGVPFRGNELATLLREILVQYEPERIVVPHPLDTHEDHRAFSFFIHEALTSTGLEAEEWSYLVHWASTEPWVPSTYRREADWVSQGGNEFVVPQFVAPDGGARPLPEAVRFALSPGFDPAAKVAALKEHESQMLVDGDYLWLFVKAEEILWAEPFNEANEALSEVVLGARRVEVGHNTPTLGAPAALAAAGLAAHWIGSRRFGTPSTLGGRRRTPYAV